MQFLNYLSTYLGIMEDTAVIYPHFKLSWNQFFFIKDGLFSRNFWVVKKSWISSVGEDLDDVPVGGEAPEAVGVQGGTHGVVVVQD